MDIVFIIGGVTVVVLLGMLFALRSGRWQPARKDNDSIPAEPAFRFETLPLSSFAKISILVWTALGFLFGMVCFLAGVSGIPVHAEFFSFRLEGMPAAIAGLVLFPLLSGVSGLIVSPLAWPFANCLLKWSSGLKLSGGTVE